MRSLPAMGTWDASYNYHGNPSRKYVSTLPQASMCLKRRNKIPRIIVILGALMFVIFLRLEYLSWEEEAPQNVHPDGKVLEPLTDLENIDFSPIEGGHVLSRRLLAVSRNCTPPAIEQFPRTLLSQKQRLQGAVILHILVAAYMFIALAIACDDYFVPACERLCDLLKMSDDVAGATFMAAGSSAPELATSCIGVFVAKDDIGLGAVVGSAVFNIMFVISICALCAGHVVSLKWWPLVRDCSYYTISILALVFVIYDEVVVWYEAVILLVLYILYIVLMYFNPILEAKLTPLGDRWCCRQGDDTEPIKMKDHNPSNHKTFSDDESEIDEGDNKDVSLGAHETTLESQTLLPSGGDMKNGLLTSSTDCDIQVVQPSFRDEDDEPPKWVLHYPEGCCQRALWVISLPLTVIMFITIPDCRQPRWKRCYVLTFIMSIIWIALFSYLMVWMITIVGHTFNIPDTIMGLTFIAAGSSVPDAIASLIVVREGHGDMAVSNAVGSNVFDILLCLGMPWFLQTVVVTPNEGIQIYSAGLTYSSITLLSTVVFLLVATHVNKWRLTKGYGVLLMVVYVLFNILASLYELNIFGYVNPPTCASNY